MSVVSGVGVTPTSVAGSSQGAGVGGLSSDEFLKIIFEELSQQDPLEPNDTNALLEQLSTIRSIESDINLGDKLEVIAAQGELGAASGLIGDFISGIDEENQRVADFVGSVSRTGEGVVLNLVSGQRVRMDRVDEILDGDDAQDLLDALAAQQDNEPEPAGSDQP